MPQRNLPRLVVAGLKGGAGKTIVTLGLLRAWHKQGLRVVPFKKGPDYIDAAWLSRASEGPCYNLDPFLMSKEVILKSFALRSEGADISVLEGNRGLFDGVDELGTSSTAELARCLNAPVILVLDCTKVTRTAAALVLGCQNLDPGLDIEGVILNNVATSRHETIVRKTVERYTGLPVLGALSRMKDDPLPMRHLGITPYDEYPQALEALDRLGQIATESLDIHRLKTIADQKGDWRPDEDLDTTNLFPRAREIPPSQRPVIGIIRDEAFQFYYPENLEALERTGARCVLLNALRDKSLPELDALYVGGGFPETQAAHLSANEALRNRLRHVIYQGLPVYAECGGLMYLGRQVIWHKKAYPMVGAIGWDFVVRKRPVGHGYTILEVTSPNPFYEVGISLRGHEFHYSRPVAVNGRDPGRLSCHVVRGHGFDRGLEGLVFKNVFGTYTHVHALGNPEWALCIVRAAMKYKKGALL